MRDVIRSFIDDARTILAHGPSDEALDQLMARMKLLVRHPTVLHDHEAFLARSATDSSSLYADTGRRSEVLHTDETGLTLVRSRFFPDQATPVHSHGTWGVLGVYAGQDLHRSYARRDPGRGAGTAELQLLKETILGPGDVALIPRPPQDIHQQQGHGGEPAFELVLFGKNAMVIPRLIFNVAAKTAREVIPGQR